MEKRKNVCTSGIANKRVITMLLAVSLILGGCQDSIAPSSGSPEGGTPVEVVLQLGFADENDAGQASSQTRGGEASRLETGGALDARLVWAASTKSATTQVPDHLYNLEIYQYRADGSYLASATSLGNREAGSYLAVTLNDNGGQPCQLLIVARGSTGAFAGFGTQSLSEVRKLAATCSVVETADVITGSNIQTMPYLLYLPEVKIVSNRIVSPDGADVRLQLKRLAAALTLDWSLSAAMKTEGYVLTEVRLMQVPHDYFILPERETEAAFGEMYPVSVSEFADGFRLTDKLLAAAGGEEGSQTLWLPANARGIRTDVTSPLFRDKDHAHSTATYAEFVVDHAARKERLFYRVYLGGNETTDFNLLEKSLPHSPERIRDREEGTEEQKDKTFLLSSYNIPRRSLICTFVLLSIPPHGGPFRI